MEIQAEWSLWQDDEEKYKVKLEREITEGIWRVDREVYDRVSDTVHIRGESL